MSFKKYQNRAHAKKRDSAPLPKRDAMMTTAQKRARLDYLESNSMLATTAEAKRLRRELGDE